MRYWVLGLFAVVCVADAAPQWTEEAEWAEKKTRPDVYWQDDTPILFKGKNPLMDSMGKPRAGGAFKQEGFALWCPSIIKVDNTYHMFCSRWKPDDPKKCMNGWTSGHIVRATSKSLTGPYEFQEIVLEPRTGQNFYDSFGVHNPKITKYGDQFILCYIMIPDAEYKKTDAFKNGSGGYQTGIVTSDSINGPWKRCDEPVAPFNNPALWIHEDGRVQCWM